MYSWKSTQLPPKVYLRTLEKQREKMLAMMPDEKEVFERKDDRDIQILREEWMELLSERDKALQDCIEEDNSQIFDDQMKKLYHLLTDIGFLDHSKSSLGLKSGLCYLYLEVKNFCSQNFVDITKDVKNDLFDSLSIERQTPSLYERPVLKSYLSPPPLPPSTALRLKAGKHTLRNDSSGGERCTSGTLSTRRKTRSLRNRTQTPKSAKEKHATPKQFNDDLRVNLLSGKKNLKSTPGVKRSPGGTPAKKKLNLDVIRNAGDLVTVALHKKFRNVRRLYTSPIQGENANESREDSFNISID